MIINALYTYPIKGLSAAPLMMADLKPQEGFPDDRRYALALPETGFDPCAPRAYPKTKFLMLMKHEKLAQLRTYVDGSTQEIEIRDRAGALCLRASLQEKEGIAAIERFFADYMAGHLTGPPRLVAAQGHRFTDVSVTSEEMMQAVSLINLASIRALEAVAGRPIDPMRFRSNIYFENTAPWSEFDLLGTSIRIGDAELDIVQRTRRCPATDVDPQSAARDMDIPGLLHASFGHADMGVYAIVRTGGTIRIGDKIKSR